MAYIFSANEETLVLLFEGKLLVAVDGVVICCVCCLALLKEKV